jgi:hypothetical protein
MRQQRLLELDRRALAQRRVQPLLDAHSVREFGTVRYGIDQARRAGLNNKSVLNRLVWKNLGPPLRR